MILAKLVETHVSNSKNLNSNVIFHLLREANVTVESTKVNQKYKDEIIYDLGRVNRC